MKYKIEIELFEEHQTVNFYTLRFQDEVTEVDYHIRTRIKKGQISIYQKKLFGNLTFQLKIDL